MKTKQLQIIEHYGMDNQINMLLEEAAELVQAICKWKRYYKSESAIDFLDLLIEEIADVKNLIEQLEQKSDYVKEGIEVTIEHKVNRELGRINRR